MDSNNVVVTIFDIESEAFQAFNELSRATYGEGYDVYEAALVKVENGAVKMLDGFSFAPADADTSTGIIIGSLVGIIGGPLGVLLGAFFSVAPIMNPLNVYAHIHRNPFPLVWTTLRESGIYAFFTRSSAANIPVNLSLCKRLRLDEDTYSISIPLGATINMSGAAITIAVLSLAAAHTLGLDIDMPTALLLCIIATVGACGASGVAGGSLLLIPVACSSFGIGNDIAMQVVGVGFIIGVLQDSCETALNSSSDVLFTATAELTQRAKAGTLTAADMVPDVEED